MQSQEAAPQTSRWPTKHDIFGVQVSATNYAQVIQTLLDAAQRGEPAIADFMPVHGLVTAARDEKFRAQVNDFAIVAPDGQPVRWALNYFHKAGLSDRVYGPELTWRICGAAAERGIGIYVYGASDEVNLKLREKLIAAYPNLKICGFRSPPFRPLTEAETQQYIQEINDSGASVLLLGIGCPRQEIFAWEHRKQIKPVQLCVGAAFDFHAGTKKMAPAWMQKRGMEWLFRLKEEPGRLWKRYLVYNSLYIYLFIKRVLFPPRSKGSSPPAIA